MATWGRHSAYSSSIFSFDVLFIVPRCEIGRKDIYKLRHFLWMRGMLARRPVVVGRSTE
jgi:hypothetical protein